MEEKDKSEEPLLQKKSTIEEYLNKKEEEQKEDKKEEPKEDIINTEIKNEEEKEDNDSDQLLQDKLIPKYSKEDIINVNEDFEGIKCPESERYTYDPYLESNIINRFFFHWAFTILKMAKKYRLTASDLGKPSKKNDSHYFAQKLHRIWDDMDYKHIQNHALFKTVLRSNACSLIIVMILSAIRAALDYFSVIITKQFIDYFDKSEMKRGEYKNDYPLWFLGLMFLGTQIISTFLSLHTQMIQTNFGNRAGYELNCFIYNKILNYAPSGFIQRANHGEIINFIQIDSMRLSFLVSLAPNACVAPMMIAAYIYLLFDFFGLTFISGLIVLLSFMVSNYFIAKEFRKRQKLMMGKKDQCMKVTTETLENIKILKLYNWENEFKNKILDARRIEMDFMSHRYVMSNVNQTINWLCPTLVSIVTIGFYQMFNDSFNISTMLIGLSIFSKLQGPVRMLPNIINQTLETTVSLKRIEEFLKQPDINQDLIKRGVYDENGEYAIKIDGGNFSWGVKQKKKSRWDLPGRKKKGMNKIKDIQIKEGEEIITNKEDALLPNSEDDGRSSILSQESKDDSKKDLSKQKSLGNEEGNEIEIEGCKIQIPIPKGIDFDLTLKNIKLEIKPGELVAIVGEVGCGKSSLLQAIINSLILLNPKECDGIHINGKVGYAAQIPWIQNDTIRNNILFSLPFDEVKYNRVLNLCQLMEDLETFGGKDLTEIGEKGINLSGGQKVRISLARTIYNEPDIYLFDDPISALDANVGKKIMKNCIVKYLKGKTRIVVTHALSYLKYMDRIIYMKQGRIEWTGNYEEVQSQPFFAELAKSTGFSRVISGDMNENQKQDDKKRGDNLITQKDDEKIAKIIKEEEQSIRGVKFKVYFDYFRYMGGLCYILSVVLVVCLWQANKGGSDLWLAYWSLPENQNKNKWVFFSVFSILGIVSVVFMFFRICMLTRGVVKLGRDVHRDMVEKLIKAPINLFHETIPRGQIYNRLSKDLDTMNFSMWALGDFLISLLSVVGSFVLCGIYDPYSLFYMPIVFVIGYFVTKFYLQGSRPLTRISSISRSPILNLISETLPGNSTIRAFQLEAFYKDNYYNKINNSLNINLISRGTGIWFQEMFKFVSIFYLTYLVLKTVLDEENVTAQSCSIVFTYSVLLQEYLGNIFNRCANLENDMISMERCCKYMDIIQEKPSHIPEVDDNLIQENWPKNGEIEFKNFSVKYRPETEIVLKNINFHILPKEKVGVCGRTGSGKSTICLCLFRLLEAYDGQILIDNIDISTIGLDLLRSSITIIPQDPCLLEGTLKYNIDPFNQIKGEEIIQILKDIGFDYTEPDDKIMDKMIEPGGANLSVGQKQLVCIARALLRKSKIVVMDEATANIDMNTEQIIQKALKLVLEQSTVITVAHRIKTIINYDKILVLDNGKVKEFDSPSNLLKDENSLFHELYSKSTL